VAVDRQSRRVLDREPNLTNIDLVTNQFTGPALLGHPNPATPWNTPVLGNDGKGDRVGTHIRRTRLDAQAGWASQPSCRRNLRRSRLGPPSPRDRAGVKSGLLPKPQGSQRAPWPGRRQPPGLSSIQTRCCSLSAAEDMWSTGRD
jgi:hypothetical protein